MPIIRWDDAYSVGVEVIDNEHKTLIDIINRAFDSTTSQDETMHQLALDMNEYALIHFATEERLMAEHGFPADEAHQASHAEFLNRANGKDRLDPIEQIKYLANWLNSHIFKADKALGEFLVAKGVK